MLLTFLCRPATTTAALLVGLYCFLGIEPVSAQSPCPANTSLSRTEGTAGQQVYVETVCKTADGQKLGPITRLRPDGALLYEAVYGANGLEGVARRFSAEGRILLEENWHNNLREGEVIENYENGSSKSRCTYLRGQLHGLCVRNFANGATARESSHQEGLLHGQFREFHRNGLLLSEGSYNQGKKTGLWKTRNPSGDIIESGHYQSDQKTGEWRELVDGQVFVANYQGGRLHGQRRVFQNETLTRTENWKDDTRISITPSPTRPWYPFALGVELGATFGSDTVIENRVHLLYIPGSANESIDGESASGVQFGVGIEGTRGCVNGCDLSRSTLGAMFRVGWSSAWAGSSSYAIPRYTLYTDITPYLGNHNLPDSPKSDLSGVRIGIGVSSLGLSKSILTSFADDSDDKGLGAIIGLFFSVFNHVELTAEIEKSEVKADKDYRLGFTFGFGM